MDGYINADQAGETSMSRSEFDANMGLYEGVHGKKPEPPTSVPGAGLLQGERPAIVRDPEIDARATANMREKQAAHAEGGSKPNLNLRDFMARKREAAAPEEPAPPPPGLRR